MITDRSTAGNWQSVNGLLTRRQLTLGLVGGAAGMMSGCATNQDLGRDQLMLVSDEQLRKMGQDTWANMRRTQKRADAPAKRAELEGVGKRIVDASGRTDENWEFDIFEGPPNAFVLPGGKVGFFSGMYAHAQNEARVANVLGHETGHVTARHAAERYSQHLLASAAIGILTAGLVGASGRNQSTGTQAIAGILGAGIAYGVLMAYSREHELEADRLGLNYMAKAGYDPRESTKFWESMTRDSKNRAKPIEFLSTHPSDETRIAAMQAEMPNALSAFERSPQRVTRGS